MAVRVLQNSKVYYAPSCHLMELVAGEVVEGDVGEWLRVNFPLGVVVLDAPASSVVVSVEPELSSGVVVPAVLDFDPGEFTGPEVIAFAREHPEWRGELRVLELGGKARTSVLVALAS